MLWGLHCTSSWTWCIGMYLPFILLRLWGWPGFWTFVIPNVLGCALFGFVMSRERSRAMISTLGPVLALFSAFTVAYQLFFAGWAAQAFFAPEGALSTVTATGVPIALLALASWLALRSERALLGVAAVVFVLALAGAAWAASTVPAAERPPLVPLTRLLWAVPTIVAGFLLCPYLDLTFHRALQRAPQPRVAFATFGVTFALMLIAVAAAYDPGTGAPLIGPGIAVLWSVQLAYTVAVHVRELGLADKANRIPGRVTMALAGGAVLLATPAFRFTLGPRLPELAAPLLGNTTHALLPGEPLYLAFLGGYGWLFPALLWFGGWHRARPALLAVLAVGVPCYLLGAWDFATYLMPVPILVALLFRSQPVHGHRGQRAGVDADRGSGGDGSAGGAGHDGSGSSNHPSLGAS